MKKSIVLATIFLYTTQAAAQILDDVHYYVTDRKATNTFFETNFGAKQMAELPMNPLVFINFLQINPAQTTINVSPQGPFEGIKVGDPKRWIKTLAKPSLDNPLVYGPHWTCLSTRNLTKSLQKLQANGVQVATQNLVIPTEPNAKTAVVYTPDLNTLLLVERPKQSKTTEYQIDHVLFLVENLATELKFYQDVIGTIILKQTPNMAMVEIGRHFFIFAEPEAIGLNRAQVVKKEAGKFYPGIDHIGFLYKDLATLNSTCDRATALGYEFLKKPSLMYYYDKPTPYTFGILFSPSGFQVELEIEEGGRYGARTGYLKDKTK
jgi:catechol 2,3-dioxygenase-like lactoylglutathione lyase family enzyme